MKKTTRRALARTIYSGVFLALALLLPFLTAQMAELGRSFCPMHLPILLCGFICGAPWGFAVGACAPLLRFLMFGMPVLYPNAIAMAFELAFYGFMAGWLYHIMPKKLPYVYISLLISMVAGRAVWGMVMFVFSGISQTEFGASAFLSGAVTNSIPGMAIQIVLIPLIIFALQKNKLMLNN